MMDYSIKDIVVIAQEKLKCIFKKSKDMKGLQYKRYSRAREKKNETLIARETQKRFSTRR